MSGTSLTSDSSRTSETCETCGARKEEFPVYDISGEGDPEFVGTELECPVAYRH